MKRVFEFEKPVTFYLFEDYIWNKLIEKYGSIDAALPHVGTAEGIVKYITKMWIYDNIHEDEYNDGAVNVRYMDGRDDFWFCENAWGLVIKAADGKHTPIMYNFYKNFERECWAMENIFSEEERNEL